jgi:hypothetical protein
LLKDTFISDTSNTRPPSGRQRVQLTSNAYYAIFIASFAKINIYYK